jgi:hypothetical protein
VWLLVREQKITLVQPGRTLVKEGFIMEEVKPDNLRKRYIYLFNDLVVITKPKKIGKEIRYVSPLYQISGIKRMLLNTILPDKTRRDETRRDESH